MRMTKNIFTVVYRDSKQDRDQSITVVAATFDEALQKAKSTEALKMVRLTDEDQVDIQSITRGASINIE